MHITILLIITYILSCLRILTAPWKYFQLNARYFSDEQGIFSKLSLDQLIPDRWRLAQNIDSEALEPTSFPVFMKPEWGQNAHGIRRADNLDELKQIRAELSGSNKRYLMQQAAPGAREFEIFSIDSNRDDAVHDVLTITEAINDNEHYPINSKYNRHTRYADVTDQFSAEDCAQLASYLSEIGEFGISRMSVRADSHASLIAGDFHVIEINLFLPMPINLLDSTYSWQEKWRFIRRSMMALAKSTKMIKPVERPQPIFTRMMTYGKRRTAKVSKPTIGQRYTQP